MNPLVSVIIPVYRTEQYLKQCVDSVLSQTYREIEIVLVDDGSPDKSGMICDEYAKNDSRVKVIHKENGGSSSARNAGLYVAQGEYVLFLDSDDYYLNTNCIELLVNKARNEKCDIVLFQSLNAYVEKNKFIDNEGAYDLEAINGKNRNEIFYYLVKNNKAVATPVNKLIESKIIQERDIYFREGITGEDIDWAVRLFVAAKKIVAVNEMVYVYRKENVNSVTHNVSKKSINDFLETIKVVIKWANDWDKEFAETTFSYMAFVYATLYCNIAKYGDISEFTEVKEYDWLFRYAIDKKTKLVRVIYRLFGFKNGIKIIGKLREIRRKVRTR